MRAIEKNIIKPLISVFFSLLIFISPWQLHAGTAKILVTLKPLHSLVSALTLNISEPELLFDSLQSPHDYTMKPSDRRRINRADIIIYASPSIESFMPTLQSSLSHKKIINLTNIADINLLQARAFDLHGDKKMRHHSDGHIWLSVNNAIIISQYLSREFIKLDGDNAKKYRSNSRHLITRLKQLKKELQLQMQPVSSQPFLMFHDSFQYFENDFKLTAGLFVTTSPEHKVGIRHIRDLKNKIQQQNIRCVFYEPPYIPKIIQTITEGQAVQLTALEPMGIEYQAGHEQYFKLLRNISNKLYHCLKQGL